MRKKFITGALSTMLILGGAAAVGASKNNTRTDDSVHQENQKTSISTTSTKQTKVQSDIAGREVEVESEHGKSFIKINSDDHDKRIHDSAYDGQHHNRHSGDDDDSDGHGK
jgi:ABC-type Zn uptake system ZnuABC Zn-binding protein ZnuA